MTSFLVKTRFIFETEVEVEGDDYIHAQRNFNEGKWDLDDVSLTEGSISEWTMLSIEPGTHIEDEEEVGYLDTSTVNENSAEEHDTNPVIAITGGGPPDAVMIRGEVEGKPALIGVL